MINYREIFNVSYGYLLLGIVIVMLIIMLCVNKDLISNIKIVRNILLVSGIACLFVNLIINFGIRLIIDDNYLIFVRVIGDNLCRNLFYSGIIDILFGIVLWIVKYYLVKRKKILV